MSWTFAIPNANVEAHIWPDDGLTLQVSTPHRRAGRPRPYLCRLLIEPALIFMLGWQNRTAVSVAWGSGDRQGLLKIAPVRDGFPSIRMVGPSGTRQSWLITVSDLPASFNGHSIKRRSLCIEMLRNESDTNLWLLATLPDGFHKHYTAAKANYPEQIIGKFGGIRRMARTLGLPPSTVQSWKISGRIPSQRQEQILVTARQLGIDLTPASFFNLANLHEPGLSGGAGGRPSVPSLAAGSRLAPAPRNGVAGADMKPKAGQAADHAIEQEARP